MQYTSKYSVKIQSYGTSAVKESLFFADVEIETATEKTRTFGASPCI